MKLQIAPLLRPCVLAAVSALMVGAVACGSGTAQTRGTDSDGETPDVSTCPGSHATIPVLWISVEIDHSPENYWVVFESILEGQHEAAYSTVGWGQAVAVSPAEAAAMGASGIGDPVWVPTGARQPFCRMTPAGYHVRKTGDGGEYLTLERLLEGDCEAAEGVWPYIGLRSVVALDDSCVYSTHAPIWEEGIVGEFALEQLSLPEPFATALDPASCPAPDCQLMVGADEFGAVDGFRITQLQITHLRPDSKDECEWPFEDFDGLFVGDAMTSERVEWVGARGVVGVVEDVHGAVTFVTQDWGQLTLWDPSDGGTPQSSRAIEWYYPHEEDRVFYSLAPYCGP